MKSYVYLIILTLCFSIARASDENVGDLIVLSYKETQDEKIKDFQGDGFLISFQKESIVKQAGLNDGILKAFITIAGKRRLLFEQKDFNPYGQDVFVFSCKTSDSNLRLFIQTRYASSDNTTPWFIQFTPYVFILESGKVKRDYNFENKYFYGGDYFTRRIIDDEKIIVKYPFYTAEKVIERFYKSKLCSENDNPGLNPSFRT
ncbi:MULTISPECIES: hypothetical protein [unclassified Vibrio]|uniref:hypothetical protein n=1 Tax=unclassified Vibrio TaxID=2614977 RepID=UPI0014837B51|nr:MULTISPECIES: hypothetical protein [unclassified Vibrio]NNN43383.1 hypothetical protein [Vibrio sp. 1-1(7)]NNN71207.1 hypothetical protein [Vibrio sp. 12-2(3-a)]